MMFKMIFTLLVLTLLVTMQGGARADGGYAIYESESAFEDVMEGLKMAIQERGMYINNIMHMDEMLERTGKDLGLGGKLYEHAESVEFCSAVLSRKMVTENPARIVNCPFTISVYTLPGEEGKTHVVHREIPVAEAQVSEVMTEVAQMLKGVASAAAEW